MHTYEMHTYEKHAMRGTPMRDTPMRDTPMRGTPMRGTPREAHHERHAYGMDANARHAMRDTAMRGPRERFVHSIHVLEALTHPAERAVRTLLQVTQELAHAPAKLTARSSPL
jgi:hypothetical protein